MLTVEQVSQHNSFASCWVIINGHVYDVTSYLFSHPGGASSILRFGGKDATEEYDPIHPAGTIEKHLPKDKHLGPISSTETGVSAIAAKEEEEMQDLTPLSTLQNLNDFESEARKHLTTKAWVYYSSAADSLSSHQSNVSDWGRVILRPRVLRNVARVSTRCRIMGHESSLPIFIAPAAQARLGHPDGELCLATGAARYNIPYCTSSYSSVSHADLASRLASERQGGCILFQLYVPIQKQHARRLISEARRLDFKALVVTVDSAVIGKREEDDRYKAQLDHDAGVEIPRTANPDPSIEAPVLRGAHSSTLDWDDLEWIREEWADHGPVILKGIQTVEDAVRAAEAGVQGIYLSNHGGRQLDHAPSSLRTLLEIRHFAPHLLGRIDIYMDGGVRRGTDVIKAVALGATAVGLGRPFMYALSGYGTDGVCRALQILGDEIETTLRLMGLTDVAQLRDFHVNSTALELELPRRVDLQPGPKSKL